MRTPRGKKLQHTLLRRVGRAIADHHLIVDGDRVMLALSGGKDIWTLLHALHLLQKKAPVAFELHVFAIDQGFAGFDVHRISEYLQKYRQISSFVLFQTSFHEIMKRHADPRTCVCALCSRLRRGILYRLAREHGMTKIALAHHADDLIETLLLNMFFNGRIKAMAPLLRTDDGSNTVIRPLCYVEEGLIAQVAESCGFPIIRLDCPASSAQQQQRSVIKKLIAQLECEHPGIRASLLSALGRVDGRHLMDKGFSYRRTTNDR